MIEVTLIPTEAVGRVWKSVEPLMQKASEYTYGRFEAIDILDGLFKGEQLLWIAFDDANVYGAVVTEVYQYPRMRALMMHFVGGEKLAEWKAPMLSLLRKYAKDNNCSVLESYGRAGWGKIFKDDGYTSRFVFYEIPVEDQHEI